MGSEKSWVLALLLCIFLGQLGIHRFYVGKIGTGIIYLLTGGLFGIGWVVDLILIIVGKFKDKEGRLVKPFEQEVKDETISLKKIPREIEGFYLGSSFEQFKKQHKYIEVPEEEAKKYYFSKSLFFGQKLFILDDKPLKIDYKQITVGYYKEKLFTIGVMNLMPTISWKEFIGRYVKEYGQPNEEKGVYFWKDNETSLNIGKVERMGLKAFNIILCDLKYLK